MGSAARCTDVSWSGFVAAHLDSVTALIARLSSRAVLPPYRVPSDTTEEQFFQRVAQPPHRSPQRQPLDSHNVFHYVPARIDCRLHVPELHYFWPPTRAISDGAEKFTHPDAMAGFFHHLAAGARNCAFIDLELAARQYPKLILRSLHDGNQRARAIKHHDSACRLNSFPRHARPICQSIRLAKLQPHMQRNAHARRVPVGNYDGRRTVTILSWLPAPECLASAHARVHRYLVLMGKCAGSRFRRR